MAGVCLIPGPAHRLRSNALAPLDLLAAMATAPGGACQELDWEQRWEPAAGGTGGSYSVSAVLPADMSQQEVGWVAAVCDGCAAERSERFPGPLGTAELPPPTGGGRAGSDRGRAAVVFLLRSSPAAPAGTASAGQSATKAAGSAASRRAGRRLLQAAAAPGAPSNCSLAVGSAPAETFAGCKSVVTAPAAPYQVFCTLEPTATGGTRWRGGVKVGISSVGGQGAG